MPSLDLTMHKAIVDDFDLDEVIADFPEGFTVKGMFFRQIVRHLGPAFEEIRPTLTAPPRGSYIAFSDYPQVDYTIVSGEVAKRRYPRLTFREAFRRLARDDVEVFANSVLGKVTMALVGDVWSGCMKLPMVYDKVASGPWGFGAERIDGGVDLDIALHPGDWSYLIGQIEGLAVYFDAVVRTQIEWEGRRVHIRVRPD